MKHQVAVLLAIVIIGIPGAIFAYREDRAETRRAGKWTHRSRAKTLLLSFFYAILFGGLTITLLGLILNVIDAAG